MIEFWKPNIISKNLGTFKSVLLIHKQSLLPTNVIIMAFMLLFTLSCGKAEKPVSDGEGIVTELEFESKMRFRLDMKDLEVYYDDLAVAIIRQNWDGIQKNAMQLNKMLPIVSTGRKMEELPKDFVTFDSEYHLSTLKLVEAAEAGEMDQLNIEYEKVKQACDNCHRRYKEE